MGGLVTTYGAGMAVPDWPGTYGYNLFLYPLSRWLPLWETAVWDVFLEHSHRLLGSLSGFLAIGLVITLWWGKAPGRLQLFAGLVLLGIISQGVLGGLRVLGDDLLLAKVHGCTAPLVFALVTAAVTFNSPTWARADRLPSEGGVGRLKVLVILTSLAIYTQIVLGAQLRHVPPESWPITFSLWVWLHVIGAVLVLGLAVWVAASRVVAKRRSGPSVERSGPAPVPMIARRQKLLLGLVVVQVLLGIATWVTSYGWPRWFTDYFFAWQYTVTAEDPAKVWSATGHVAFGSLCLACSVSLLNWCRRYNAEAQSAEWLARLGDWFALVRPRLLGMVLLTVLTSVLIAAGTLPPWDVWGHGLIGSGLVIAGALAVNQALESRSDAQMLRTALRPLPSGRLTTRKALAFGIVLSFIGLIYLGYFVNLLATVVAIVSWIVYVGIYTPLKTVTLWQTGVGAIAGAMPVLLGAAIARAPSSVAAWLLFGILYFWQFPHSMAIAWLYREQFASAGLKVATVVDPSGRPAAVLALVGAFALVGLTAVGNWMLGFPLSLGLVTIVLAIGYLVTALFFAWHPDLPIARWLFRISLIHLGGTLLMWVFALVK